MSRLLVVEDDPGIRSALIHALSDHGHAVDSAPNAMQGLQQAISGDPELVVLDLGLPRRDGLEVLRQLRARRQQMPVLVATARRRGRPCGGAGRRGGRLCAQAL